MTTPSSLSQSGTRHTCSMPAALTIDTVGTFLACLESFSFSAGDSLVLDASATEVITTPGAQVLLAVDKILQSSGGSLQVHHAREALADAFHSLGLAAHFSTWSTAHA